MGLDLRLYPVEFSTTNGRDGFDYWHCHLLHCHRNYHFFDLITKTGRTLTNDIFEIHPVPARLRLCKNDVCYTCEEEVSRYENTDAYGSPLQFCYAAEFHKIDLTNLDNWNKAIVAFMRALPPMTPVVLYWC